MNFAAPRSGWMATFQIGGCSGSRSLRRCSLIASWIGILASLMSSLRPVMSVCRVSTASRRRETTDLASAAAATAALMALRRAGGRSCSAALAWVSVQMSVISRIRARSASSADDLDCRVASQPSRVFSSRCQRFDRSSSCDREAPCATCCLVDAASDSIFFRCSSAAASILATLSRGAAAITSARSSTAVCSARNGISDAGIGVGAGVGVGEGAAGAGSWARAGRLPKAETSTRIIAAQSAMVWPRRGWRAVRMGALIESAPCGGGSGRGRWNR